ncbi:hypothetical protein EDE08_103252 [Bradyrhizobium sp. R2.2-H]|uniref:hypothetical protein n=1 Tax=unclassified Bradyrhizobium TaxID=2631580 RepID=UPI00104E90BE|nr:MULTISPECIES: hypothetical protein [unclassified Bradyrhizobium]TCU75036.1 hypothetical protein EDE10_103251 [Bradyrhizobium sp. Y-H1]TCU77804.1 hypothetical protein EDE08_103252 [Bradyrhizobium sp. R2.2-H]
MSLYGALFNTPFAENRCLQDWQWKFEFQRYPIDARPQGRNCVYGFVSPYGFVHYIGRAEDLATRIGSHDRIDEAKRDGATELWVHRTDVHSKVHFHDVEQRLIRTLCPPLNSQHNSLAGLGGLLGLRDVVAGGTKSDMPLGLLGALKL